MAKDRRIELSYSKKEESKSGKNYLLTIGINEYHHFSPLNNAVRDAETIRDILLEKYQFEPEYTTSLFDGDASRENILEALYNLEDRITPEDNFLLYFAGHGVMNTKGTQGFWIPVEAENKRAQFIANTRIRDILKDIEAHHTYLIIDSCFSGSMILRKAEQETNLLENLPSRRVLTSGRKQVVADGPSGGHSPFANCIIQYLKAYQKEGISALDLEYHVQKNTPKTAEQHPEASFIYGMGDQSGQFVFYSRNIQQEIKWEDLEGNLKNCKGYLKDHPEGELIERVYWEIANLTGEVSDYRTYARKFRRGKFISEALEKITSHEEAQVFNSAKKRGWTALMQFINRFPESKYIADAEAEILRIENEEEKATQSPVKNNPAVKKDTIKEKIEPPKIKVVETNSKTKPITSKVKQSTIKKKSASEGLIEMVFVEGGSFMMGGDVYQDEKPIHKVTLDSFEIGKYPITQKQWEDIMGNNPSEFKGCANCPVETISWNDVQEFLKKINAIYPGMNYRLPTEAEWEYAARGGKLSQGYVYAGSNRMNEVGWYGKNSSRTTQLVGQKKANELGLYDMSGNVWEWCYDSYGEYSFRSQTNPRGPSKGRSRVVRGGFMVLLTRRPAGEQSLL